MTNNPGTLTFEFLRVQAAQGVPGSTVSIRFDWLGSSDEVLSTDREPFAESITLTPPGGTAAVRITPLSADGFPLFSLQGPVSRPPDGANVTADLSTFQTTDIKLKGITLTPDPVTVSVDGTRQVAVTGNFSNDQDIPFPASALAEVDFTPDSSGFYSVSQTGLISGEAAGTGSLSAGYTFSDDGESTPVTDSVTVDVADPDAARGTFAVTPDPLLVGIGTTSDPVTVTFTPPGGQPQVIANVNVDFSFDTAGFSAGEDGTVSVDEDVVPDTEATLTAGWTAPQSLGGGTYSDTVSVTARCETPPADLLLSPVYSFALPLGHPYILGLGTDEENLFLFTVQTYYASPFEVGGSMGFEKAPIDLVDLNIRLMAESLGAFNPLDTNEAIFTGGLGFTVFLYNFQLSPPAQSNVSLLEHVSKKPSGLAVAGDGAVFFSAGTTGETTGEGIFKFPSPDGGTPVLNFGTSGSGKLNTPKALSFGPDGMLYVLDTGDGRVVSFNSEGEYQSAFDLVGEAMDSALAIDEGGLLYTMNGQGGGDIYDTSTGAHIGTIANTNDVGVGVGKASLLYTDGYLYATTGTGANVYVYQVPGCGCRL